MYERAAMAASQRIAVVPVEANHPLADGEGT